MIRSLGFSAALRILQSGDRGLEVAFTVDQSLPETPDSLGSESSRMLRGWCLERAWKPLPIAPGRASVPCVISFHYKPVL